MSVRTMGRVWELQRSGAGIAAGEMLVLLAMADHADHDGGSIRPGLELIAEKTGFSTRTVRRHVSALRAQKILREVRAAGQHRPTEYVIDFPDRTDRPVSAPSERAIATDSPAANHPSTETDTGPVSDDQGALVDANPRSGDGPDGPSSRQSDRTDCPPSARAERAPGRTDRPVSGGTKWPPRQKPDRTTSTPRPDNFDTQTGQPCPPNRQEPSGTVERGARARPSDLDEVKRFFRASRFSEAEAERFHTHYAEAGWMRGGAHPKPIRDWQAVARLWMSRAIEFGRAAPDAGTPARLRNPMYVPFDEQ